MSAPVPPGSSAPRRPRWLHVGCLTGVAAMVAFAVPCTGLVGVGLVASGPRDLVVAVALALAFTLPYGLMLLWLDRNEREPPWLVATAFLWGAVVATALSGTANTLFEGAASLVLSPGIAAQATASVSAPVVEEITKAVALLVLVVVFRREFDNVLDGVIYGAIVGLGFAWFENITYYVAIAQDEGIAGMVRLAYVRGLLNGVGSHAAYTALTGLGFGLWRVMRRGPLRWAMPPGFLAIAMFAHFAWNTFAVVPVVAVRAALQQGEAVEYLVAYPAAVAVLQVPFLLVLGGVILLAWRHEDHIIRTFLVAEADDVVAPEVRGRLVPARRRLAAGVVRLFVHGPGVWWRTRRLERQLIDLAFLKWHHARDGRDEGVEVRRMREAARTMARRIR